MIRGGLSESVLNARRTARRPRRCPIPTSGGAIYSSVIDLAGASSGARGSMGAIEFDGGAESRSAGRSLIVRHVSIEPGSTPNLSPSRGSARPVETHYRAGGSRCRQSGVTYLCDGLTLRVNPLHAVINLMRGLLVSLYVPCGLSKSLRPFPFHLSTLEYTPRRHPKTNHAGLA
jgi:hypothetical protein